MIIIQAYNLGWAWPSGLHCGRDCVELINERTEQFPAISYHHDNNVAMFFKTNTRQYIFQMLFHSLATMTWKSRLSEYAFIYMSFASAVNIDYLKGSHIFFVEYEPQNSKTIVRLLTACFLVRLSNFVDFYFYFVMLAHKQALLGECQVNLKTFWTLVRSPVDSPGPPKIRHFSNGKILLLVTFLYVLTRIHYFRLLQLEGYVIFSLLFQSDD